MNGQVLYRAADRSDVEVLRDLAEDSPGAPVWSRESWDQVVTSVAEGCRRRVLIAERDGKALGFAVCGIAADQAEIESLAVRREMRREGVGSRLCEQIFAWARSCGAAEILLEVRASNTAARALYVSLGFAEQGIRRQYYREPAEDAVVMVRRL